MGSVGLTVGGSGAGTGVEYAVPSSVCYIVGSTDSIDASVGNDSVRTGGGHISGSASNGLGEVLGLGMGECGDSGSAVGGGSTVIVGRSFVHYDVHRHGGIPSELFAEEVRSEGGELSRGGVDDTADSFDGLELGDILIGTLDSEHHVRDAGAGIVLREGGSGVNDRRIEGDSGFVAAVVDEEGSGESVAFYLKNLSDSSGSGDNARDGEDVRDVSGLGLGGESDVVSPDVGDVRIARRSGGFVDEEWRCGVVGGRLPFEISFELKSESVGEGGVDELGVVEGIFGRGGDSVASENSLGFLHDSGSDGSLVPYGASGVGDSEGVVRSRIASGGYLVELEGFDDTGEFRDTFGIPGVSGVSLEGEESDGSEDGEDGDDDDEFHQGKPEETCRGTIFCALLSTDRWGRPCWGNPPWLPFLDRHVASLLAMTDVGIFCFHTEKERNYAISGKFSRCWGECKKIPQKTRFRAGFHNGNYFRNFSRTYPVPWRCRISTQPSGRRSRTTTVSPFGSFVFTLAPYWVAARTLILYVPTRFHSST